MSRPKGSKNKKEEIPEEDLLSTEVEIKVTENVVAEIKPKKEKKLIGYHPITGAEVWI